MSKLFSFFLALAVAAPLASAQPSKYQYTELKPPQPTEAQGKSVEVVEFFWYGCPHCYNLEPLIEAWTKKLPPDVQFRRIPAVFNPRWAHDAAIFYTFEAMGVLDKLHKPFFDSIHRDHLRSDDQQAMSEWLQKNGVDAKKFYETMKSFSVQSKTRRAAQLSAAYKIDGTPAMAVQGRFTVSADQGRSREGMLDTVSYLVDMLRQGRL